MIRIMAVGEMKGEEMTDGMIGGGGCRIEESMIEGIGIDLVVVVEILEGINLAPGVLAGLWQSFAKSDVKHKYQLQRIEKR